MKVIFVTKNHFGKPTAEASKYICHVLRKSINFLLKSLLYLPFPLAPFLFFSLLKSPRFPFFNEIEISTLSSLFYPLSLLFCIETSTFTFGFRLKKITIFSPSNNEIFSTCFTLLLKSPRSHLLSIEILLSLLFSSKISTTFPWKSHEISTLFLLSIEISTFFSFLQWNLHFLFSVLMKSPPSLLVLIEISTFSSLFYGRLNFCSPFL